MRVAFITTCMGRLEQAKQSAAALLEDVRANYVFVDFACPDQSGFWMQERYPHASIVSLQFNVPEDEEVIFHKAVAQNQGALRAMELGADYFVFLDADMVPLPGLLDFIFEHARQDRFMVMLPPQSKRDLCGLLCVPRSAFERAGGYDTNFLGWGSVDIDMRLRLYLPSQMPWDEIPHKLATAIPHDDEMRTRHSPFDKRESYRRNRGFLTANVRRLTGLLTMTEEIDSAIKTLSGTSSHRQDAVG